MPKNILPKIDLFGTAVVFNFGGNPKAKSQHGAVCTILFILFVGWAIYHTSQDLFGRKDPKTNYAEAFYEDAREMTLTTDKFVFAFGVEANSENYLNHFINDTIYRADAYFLRRTYVEDQEGPIWDTILLETETCSLDHFGELSPSFANLPLDMLFCLKKEQPALQNLTIEGSSDSQVYGFLDMVISRCTEYNSNVTCADNDTITGIMSGSYLVVYYSNMAVNPKQSARPDNRYRDSYITMLCTTCYKQSTITLEHVTVTTDYGWLFEDSDVKTYAQIGSTWEQMDLRPNIDGYLIDCTIEVGKLEKTYTRSYIKLQDILAEVNGLATSCMLAFLILIRPFSHLKVQESLINELFNIKQNQQDKNHKKKNNRTTINTQNTYRATTLELKTLRDTDHNCMKERSPTKQEMKESNKGLFNQLARPVISIESPKSPTSGLLVKDKQNLETYAMKFRRQLADEVARG